ncbi:MAG: hypothetical protein WC250_03675, partial [Candidatus Paceibacterota bacterium]
MNGQRSPLFYMANLGSEVRRYLNCLQQSDKVGQDQSWQRILKIFADSQSSGAGEAQIKETRLLIDFLEPANLAGVDLVKVSKEFQAYFGPFASRL